MNTYVTGYNGKIRDERQLLQWNQWVGMDPELARRVKAIMDASIVAGRPLSVGGTIRTVLGQETLFYSRHEKVPCTEKHCCSYQGKCYRLRKGQSHAAPPGLSYHEPVTGLEKCLAVDFIGNLKFLAENCAEYGLIEFSGVNKEPWHGQPKDAPRGRSRYRLALHDPLKPWPLPPVPTPAPTVVDCPLPTIKQGQVNNEAEVRDLQLQCNFWGWRDAMNRTLIVDGDFGPKSEQALRVLQTALGVKVDGVYGAVTADKFQLFLNSMAGYNAS